MLRRKRMASNRHWIFVKEEILGPLNDQLAIRHGAEYQYEVTEESFDWDVEFSAIKDRSGNNLREQYIDAWVQPALIAPGEVVRQLGVKINWRNQNMFENKSEQEEGRSLPNEFNPDEVAQLMAKTDEILGSPLKSDNGEAPEEEVEVVEERPNTVTNQKKEAPKMQERPQEQLTIGSHPKSAVHRVLKIAGLLTISEVEDKTQKTYVDEPVKQSIYALQTINNAKALNSIDMQQVEVQSAYDTLAAMRDNQFTALLGFVVKSLCDKLRDGEIQDADLYDILSRITRSISDNGHLMSAPDQKIQAINNVETDVMNILSDQGINEVVTTYFKGIPAERLQMLFKLAEKQFTALRDKSLNLDLTDIPAPQVIEEYVEEIKENPPE